MQSPGSGSLHESALKREYPRALSSPLSSHVPHRLRAGTCVNACFYCRASRPSKLRNRSRCRHSAKATPVHNEHRIDPKAPNVVRSGILLPLVMPERLPDLPAVLHLLRLQTAMQDDHDLLEQNDCWPPQVSGRQNSSIADALSLPFADLASPGEKRVRNHAKTGGVDPSTGCRRQQTLLSAPFGPLALQPQQGHHRDWQERSFDPLPE
jgi:hypothetical protein